MQAKPYPKYKPSKVEWLDDIPSDWEVKRLKYVVSINDETLPETTDPDFEFLYVDIGSVDAVNGVTAVEEMIFENAPSRARRIVRNGDTIVSTVRTYLRAIAPIRESESEYIVSTGFAVIRPRDIEARYLSYALRESCVVEKIVSRSVGVSYPAVNASEISTIPIPLPSSIEQNSIADFLDNETEKIDALVAKKRQLIEKLKEKRTALISRTVTRGLPPEAARAAGLNPNPKFKPSGIEWLGDVPAHWEIWKLAHGFLNTGSGTTPPSENEAWYDGDIPWVTTSELRENIVSSTSKMISQEATVEFSALRVFPKGALVIAMYGATIGRLGILGVDAATNQACCVMYGERALSVRFMFYWFQVFREQVVILATGGGQPNISQEKIRSLKIACPCLEEQEQLANYLDQESKKLDVLIEMVLAAIKVLQEYRSSLITAAVTGKIDIRKEAA